MWSVQASDNGAYDSGALMPTGKLRAFKREGEENNYTTVPGDTRGTVLRCNILKNLQEQRK